MKTPYDAAWRWRKQELDNARSAATAQAEKVDAIDAAIEALHAEVAAEMVQANGDPLTNFAAYAAHARLREARLRDERSAAQAELDRLSEAVAEAFGEFKTLDLAADRWRAEKNAELARKEQAELDELAQRAGGE